jgi:hypothetical protein
VAQDVPAHYAAPQGASELPFSAAIRVNKLLVKLQIGSQAPQHSLQSLHNETASSWLLFGLETTSLYGQAELKLRTVSSVFVGTVSSHTDHYPLSRSYIEMEETGRSDTDIIVTEPVTGEVSGLVLNLDLLPVQRLCQIALAAQKEKKVAHATPQQQAARRPKEHNFRSLLPIC